MPGTVEYVHGLPDGSRILLGVAGLSADLSGGQGSGENIALQKQDWPQRVASGVTEEDWRSLWMYTVDIGDLVRLPPDG